MLLKNICNGMKKINGTALLRSALWDDAKCAHKVLINRIFKFKIIHFTFFISHIALAILILPKMSHAQQPFSEGTIRYLVTHNWVKKMAAVPYLSKQRKDKIAYMWKNDEWKEYKVLHFNAQETKYENSEEKAERDDENTYSWRKDAYLFKRNYFKNTQTDVFEVSDKAYIVEDSIQEQQWKILNDIKEVAGHICMKAYMDEPIKKHKIVAWFAMDIPYSYGPETFHGLPGMILELDYNDGALLVSADKIDLKKVDTDLVLPAKMKGKKVNQAAMNKMLEKLIKEKTEAEEPWFWAMPY